jgi:hypothetical protein
MELLRSAKEPIPSSAIESAWHDDEQVTRALVGLVKDALVEQTALGDYRLKGSR